jgi:hypothetical protein
MTPEGEDIDGTGAVLVIAGIFYKLIIEGEPDEVVELCIIIELADGLMPIVEAAVPNDKTIAAGL